MIPSDPPPAPAASQPNRATQQVQVDDYEDENPTPRSQKKRKSTNDGENSASQRKKR